MTKLFGTDGIRGRALAPPLDELTVRRLGGILARELGARVARPHILLAGDTRASTVILAAWLGESFQGCGGRVTWAGVLPTPAVSRLLAGGGFDAGVVISASHNPADDNGIKVLDGSGQKIDDAFELTLEGQLARDRSVPHGPSLPDVDPGLASRYLETLWASHVSARALAGLRIVVDAAHGAASGLAATALERLGASVVAIASSPNGTNINDSCGATAPQRLAARVLEEGADGGLALDGDADRAILVDERGGILDGDDILLAWSSALHEAGTLHGDRVVATVMSNYGLDIALGRRGLQAVRCPVGDRSVWLAMREHQAVLGGEQSGHVICSLHGVSGDGLLTGSHVFAIAAASGRRLSELSDLERLPQVLINVPIHRKTPFETLPAVVAEVRAVELGLAGRGRVLLRYSGTEALARVMVEGEDAALIESLAGRLADAIHRSLG